MWASVPPGNGTRRHRDTRSKKKLVASHGCVERTSLARVALEPRSTDALSKVVVARSSARTFNRCVSVQRGSTGAFADHGGTCGTEACVGGDSAKESKEENRDQRPPCSCLAVLANGFPYEIVHCHAMCTSVGVHVIRAGYGAPGCHRDVRMEQSPPKNPA
jgi:hypothetical protein